MPELANPVNADLRKGFTVSRVAEKHACPVGPEDRTGACPVGPEDRTGACPVGPEDRTGGWTEPIKQISHLRPGSF